MEYEGNSLDLTPQAFQQLIQRATDLITAHYANLDGNAYAGHSQAQVAQWFDEPLPEQAGDLEVILEDIKTKVMDGATKNIGPHMYAYVMAGGNQVSLVADWLANAVNQNVSKWHLAPPMVEIEKRVVQWVAEFIGYRGAHPSEPTGGIIVSAGSAANLSGLTVARNIFFERAGIRQRGLFGMKPCVVYASDQTHNSVQKSIEMLGIGSDQYRKIAVDDDYRIDLQALRSQLDADLAAGLQPFCLIGNAGTVNSGAIDPLGALADIAQEYQLWFHADGCYGALAVSLPELHTAFDGLERADSIACDFHKWLYQPFEIGCTLVRGWDQLKRTYHTAADYLGSSPDSGRFDINEHHFQLSRNAKAFKVWMSFKAYGAERLRTMIRKDIELRQYLDQQMQAMPDFRLVSSGPLAISCFQYTGNSNYSESQIRQLNEAIIPALEDDQRVFITGTRLHGVPVIRACIINHRKNPSHIDYLLQVIRTVGQRLEDQLFTRQAG